MVEGGDVSDGCIVVLLHLLMSPLEKSFDTFLACLNSCRHQDSSFMLWSSSRMAALMASALVLYLPLMAMSNSRRTSSGTSRVNFPNWLTPCCLGVVLVFKGLCVWG